MHRPPQPKCLVIGIGNALRGDDGVGALLADQVGGRSVQQLTPELAEDLASLEAVLFIDAWAAPPGVVPQLQSLSPVGLATATRVEPSADSHRLEPASLLAISRALYGRAPEAELLLVPAYGFEHGTALSPQLQAALPAARELLHGWLERHA